MGQQDSNGLEPVLAEQARALAEDPAYAGWPSWNLARERARDALAAGGTAIEDPPGVREGGGMKLYLAYLRDPDGNKLCALHRMP